jgi:hypothetical protein
MKAMAIRIMARASTAFFLLFSFLAFCPRLSSTSNEQAISTWVEMVILSVTATNGTTGRPIKDLKKQDFEVLDNGRATDIHVFRGGPDHVQDPLVVWFALSCRNESDAFESTKVDNLKSALNHVNPDYSIGVAHWCDNGEAKIDLQPTATRDVALAAMEATLQRLPVRLNQQDAGVAFEKALRLIADRRTRVGDHFPWQVVVVLTGDKIEIPRERSELLSKRLVFQGVKVYEIRSANRASGRSKTKTKGSLHLISNETGGRAIFLRNGEGYAAGIETILAAVESRYLMGISPQPHDGRWHSLHVRLTKGAIDRHGAAELNFGAGYLNVGWFASAPPYSISHPEIRTAAEPPTELASALDASSLKQDVRFDATAHGYEGADNWIEFEIRVEPDQLTWTRLPDGNRTSELSISAASYSQERKRLGQETFELQVTRDEANLPITGDGPFVHSEAVQVADGTSLIRVAIRDKASGRIGVQEFSLKEILAEPRKPAVLE